MKEEIIKQITNYLIQHSEVMTCSNCKFQMIAPYECAKCNKIVRSNFVAEEATRIKYEMRAEDIMEIVGKGMRVNNSVYMVRFVEPPYGGSSTDVFLFTSIQAIYCTFTKEQIGCGVKRLWNIGLAKGNAYKSKNCTITKEPFMRMKRKSAPISDDNLTYDNLHDNKSKR